MGSGLVSPWHIAIFVLVVLLVFGPKRLPEMGRSLGKGLRELKGGLTEDHSPTEAAPRALPTETPGPRDRDSI